jgi:hypothetical protein
MDSRQSAENFSVDINFSPNVIDRPPWLEAVIQFSSSGGCDSAELSRLETNLLSPHYFRRLLFVFKLLCLGFFAWLICMIAAGLIRRHRLFQKERLRIIKADTA